MTEGGVGHNCKFAKDCQVEFVEKVEENKFWPKQQLEVDLENDADWKKLWNGDIPGVKSVGVMSIKCLAHARDTLSVRVKHATGKLCT